MVAYSNRRWDNIKDPLVDALHPFLIVLVNMPLLIYILAILYKATNYGSARSITPSWIRDVDQLQGFALIVLIFVMLIEMLLKRMLFNLKKRRANKSG